MPKALRAGPAVGLRAPSLQGSPVRGARLAPARPPLSRREVGSRKRGPARDKGPVYMMALLWHEFPPSRCARGGEGGEVGC